MKAEPAGKTSYAALWVNVQKQGGGISYFNNMRDRPIRDPQWKRYSITGTFREKDSTIAFGGLFFGPGQYAYNNFALLVERTPGTWDTAVLKGVPFNDPSALNGWKYAPRDSSFRIRDNYLAIDGNRLLSPEDVIPFGKNDKAGKTAKVNGIRLYYEVYGEGEPLLLLHGNGQSIADFAKQIPELSKHYKVIAADTRMQGQSGDDGTRLSYDLFAEDAHALLDKLKIRQAHVLGWSDGGNTGLILAGKYPDRVKSLMVMGANLNPDTTSVKPEVIAAVHEELKKLKPGENEQVRRLMTMLIEEPHITIAQLGNIRCPVLVMAGSDDLIRDEHTRLIASSIPHGELHIFEKATHYIPVEDAERFNRTVLDFLKKQ